jgi:hypothetical protein
VNVIAKASLFIMAGVGATWVAREATDAFGGGTVSHLNQAQTRDSAPPPAGHPPEVKPITREEMEEELRKAQAAIAAGGAARGADSAETKEFRPTKPLPADLPVALPSDI